MFAICRENKSASPPDMTSKQFQRLVHSGKIRLAGNLKLKIYGKLNCARGKRMKKTNRVFFASEAEALEKGFRPCGHCLRKKYSAWKFKKSNNQ